MNKRSFIALKGGVYVLNIFDNYAAAGWSLLFLGFCECIAVAWLFGIDKFWDIVCDMIGFVPRFPLFKWCWAYITPFATTVSMNSALSCISSILVFKGFFKWIYYTHILSFFTSTRYAVVCTAFIWIPHITFRLYPLLNPFSFLWLLCWRFTNL